MSKKKHMKPRPSTIILPLDGGNHPTVVSCTLCGRTATIAAGATKDATAILPIRTLSSGARYAISIP